MILIPIDAKNIESGPEGIVWMMTSAAWLDVLSSSGEPPKPVINPVTVPLGEHEAQENENWNSNVLALHGDVANITARTAAAVKNSFTIAVQRSFALIARNVRIAGPQAVPATPNTFYLQNFRHHRPKPGTKSCVIEKKNCFDRPIAGSLRMSRPLTMVIA